VPGLILHLGGPAPKVPAANTHPGGADINHALALGPHAPRGIAESCCNIDLVLLVEGLFFYRTEAEL